MKNFLKTSLSKFIKIRFIYLWHGKNKIIVITIVAIIAIDPILFGASVPIRCWQIKIRQSTFYQFIFRIPKPESELKSGQFKLEPVEIRRWWKTFDQTTQMNRATEDTMKSEIIIKLFSSTGALTRRCVDPWSSLWFYKKTHKTEYRNLIALILNKISKFSDFYKIVYGLN